MNPTDPIKFNRERFKQALAHVESSGGKHLSNKTSSAAGRYHFLYRYLKDNPALNGMTKLEFINSPEAQEKVMDLALEGKLQGFTNYVKYAQKLQSNYKTDYSLEELAALTHFLGAGGVAKQLKTGDYKIPGKNASVEQYVERFRTGWGPDEEPNETKLAPQASPIIKKKDNIPTIPTPQAKPAPQEPVSDINFGFNTDYNGKTNNEVINFLNQNAYGGRGPNSGSTELVQYDNGGTHESNPLGGVPIGTDSRGVMNTVEEGETQIKLNGEDYIFSDRIGLNTLYNKK